MTISALAGVDFSSWDEPDPGLEPRHLLESWLRYQRHEFIRKLRDLSPKQLASRSVPPVPLSVLGLVRHMREMEHVYLVWGLGGGERVLLYGDDDYTGGSVESLEDDIGAYFEEVARSDAVITAMKSLDTVGAGHGRPLRACLVKMVDEYALHAGQAHMLRLAALNAFL